MAGGRRHITLPHAFVSLPVQLTRRTKETPDELKRKSAGELLRAQVIRRGGLP